MIKITTAMRRMVNDTEFFHVVKAVVEVQDMVRAYENKNRAARRQYNHDHAFRALVDDATAADRAPPVTWAKAKPKVAKPSPNSEWKPLAD